MAFYLTLNILAILVVSSSQCVRNETGTKGRLIGQDAIQGQFPYTAFFESFHESLWMKCGGSFIGRIWVLTAAKCVDGMVYGIVYLGTSMLRVSEVAYIVYPSAVHINPSWNSETSVGNIALIRIPQTDICDNIFPVPLPSIDDLFITFNRQKAIASSWNDNVHRLQWLQVTIMRNRECAKAYLYATDNIMCVSDVPSPCSTEDFGSPLLLENRGVLVGVLSTSIEYKNACVVVYTRITSYLTWIRDITGISY